MPDLNVKSPGRPPWMPRPDPWWVWAVRGFLATGAAVLVLGVPVALLRHWT